MPAHRKYFTEEELREAKRQEHKRYYQRHKEQCTAYNKRYREEHRDPSKKRYRRYANEEERSKFKTAHSRLKDYKKEDLKYSRETTVTRDWIVDHIFSSSCIYCGESDWRKLGTDRKDNSIGHTPDNCVPSCKRCNEKRRLKDFLQFVNRPWYLL